MYRTRAQRPWLSLLIVTALVAGALAARSVPLQRLEAYLPAWLHLQGPALARSACPTCTEWRHVRLDSGVVTVFYGKKETGDAVVKQRTQITAPMLLPQDRARLEQGVDLYGDAAVTQFLEKD